MSAMCLKRVLVGRVLMFVSSYEEPSEVGVTFELESKEHMSDDHRVSLQERLNQVSDGLRLEREQHQGAASAFSSRHDVRLWFVDTGCGNDLVDRSEVQSLRRLIRRSNNPITFRTANGLIKAEHEVDKG